MQRDIIKGNTQFKVMLENTILDAFKRLIEPSIEREIRSDLTEKAEEKAIKVFGQNAKQLLLGAPINILCKSVIKAESTFLNLILLLFEAKSNV